MDGRRFDQLARGLARATTRRAALKAAGCGALAPLLAAIPGGSALARKNNCTPIGRKCKHNRDCCSRRCQRNGGKRCACRPDNDRCRNDAECCTGICDRVKGRHGRRCTRSKD